MRVTRERCWKYNWVLEFDIKGLFDNIRHDLLMRAVRKHNGCKWVELYIERWLTAPLQTADGTLVERHKGTPQGGVISPVLSNLFMHYAFDVWMTRTHPDLPWCRYADDGVVHCRTERDALALRAALAARLKECGLQMHPDTDVRSEDRRPPPAVGAEQSAELSSQGPAVRATRAPPRGKSRVRRHFELGMVHLRGDDTAPAERAKLPGP